MGGVRSERGKAWDRYDSRVSGSKYASVRDGKPENPTVEEEDDERRPLQDSGRDTDIENSRWESRGGRKNDDRNDKDDGGRGEIPRSGGWRRPENYEGREEDDAAERRRRHRNDSSEGEEGELPRSRNLRESERRSDGRRDTFDQEDDKKADEDERVRAPRLKEYREKEKESNIREDGYDDDDRRRREGRRRRPEEDDRQSSRYRNQRERDGRSSRRHGNDDDLDEREDRRRHHYEKTEDGKGENSRQGSQGEREERSNRRDVEMNVGRSGGIYIPPFKLAQMMKNVEDKSSEEYQRLTWDALRKSINGLVNKVNASNVKNIIPELFSENLIRGRGLFCRSCLKSQMASPGFTDVFSALVAVVNTKFPEVGKLLLKRIILRLKRAYKRNDKPLLLAAIRFIAHLVNQQVAHEIIALELLTVLLENPTDDSVEVAVGFVKECGSLLQDLSPQGLHGIFERLRGILHEGEIDKRVQFLIEGLFAIRKAKFQGYPAVRPELDLVEQEDQFTHEFSLEDEIDGEEGLDIFRYDAQFVEHENAYEDLKKDILGDESSEDEGGSDAASDDEEDDESDEEDEESLKINDETETNLVNLRRTIYLTIMSSVDFEEAGHKLLKIKLQPGQEMELCIMLLECCSQERTYLRYYGLLGQRFCMINKVHQENFEKCFVQQYSMIHRLETNKLRNVAKFFAHLLGTDALPWHVLAYIRLTEEDTTSSSRIFIKILFQELAEQLGIRTLNERLSEPTMQESFESIFPRDNPKNARFSINFFTSIGLGGITENLRQYLKDMPRLIMQQQKPEDSSSESDDESGSSSGSESGDSDSSSESESDSSSESDRRHAKRKRTSHSDSESNGRRRPKQKFSTVSESEGRHRKRRPQSYSDGGDDDGSRRREKKRH